MGNNNDLRYSTAQFKFEARVQVTCVYLATLYECFLKTRLFVGDCTINLRAMLARGSPQAETCEDIGTRALMCTQVIQREIS